MKTKTLGWMTAVGIGAVSAAFASCAQPKTECQVALASTYYSYAVVYKVKGTPPAGCEGVVQAGELFGMEFYHPPTADNSTYDSSKTDTAIASENLGDTIAAYESVGASDPCEGILRCSADADCGDPSLGCKTGFCVATSCGEVHHRYGLGSFAAVEPDDKDMCSISTLSTAQQDLQASEDTEGAGVPGDTACTTDADCQLPSEDDPDVGDPASGSVCDATTNLCVVGCRAADDVGDAAPNTCLDPFICDSVDNTIGKCVLPSSSVQYKWSNLKFYVTAAAPGTQFSGDLTYTQDNCTIEYTAIGVWPGVYCGSDADCNPCADADAGLTIGSGINPDFPTRCDPDLGLCVLADAKDKTKNATTIPQLLDKPVDCGAVD